MKTNYKIMKVYTVTRDSGANVKILKALERDGFIKIHDVMMENGRENKKVKEKILPVGVYGHGKWGEMVWAGPDCSYSNIRAIIGDRHIEDAIQLEAHVRNKHDFFVTEDRDFLDKRDQLETAFGVRIMSPTELDALCREN